MDNKMDIKKKKVSSKKNTKKNLVKTSTKQKILATVIIVFTVLVCGGYLIHQTGVPAKVLTGATVAGESVKVNEMNYHYIELYNMYYQYGILTSKKDLQKVFDESTGETYSDYLYKAAAQNMQNIILLNQEAKKAGFKAVSAQRQVDDYVTSLRTYAATNKTTADKILQSQYGRGLSVRNLKEFMLRELTAQEYTNYLKQTQYKLTAEEMQAKYDAAPADYDNVTFNAYLVSAAIDSTATDTQKADAIALAKEQAQAILDKTTDPQSFRDASETAAGTDGASSFKDAADPTIHANMSKADITSSYSSDVADYLFSDGRTDGDKTVITTDTGAYAVYFQSRQLDTDPSVSYRALVVTNTDTAAATAKAQGYMDSVTDETSFTDLVKKNSDDSSTAIIGGLKTSVTAASLVTASPTEAETALSTWLFSADRKVGDMTIITDVDGATLYYYQKSLPAWESSLYDSNISTEYAAWYKTLAAEDGNGFTVNTEALKFATY